MTKLIDLSKYIRPSVDGSPKPIGASIFLYAGKIRVCYDAEVLPGGVVVVEIYGLDYAKEGVEVKSCFHHKPDGWKAAHLGGVGWQGHDHYLEHLCPQVLSYVTPFGTIWLQWPTTEEEVSTVIKQQVIVGTEQELLRRESC